MPPRDLCKGPRKFYNAILNAIVASPLLSGLFMGMPTYILFSSLLAGASIIPFYSAASTFVISLFVFTICSWLLELWAIRKTLPNLLAICGFCHSAIGSWWFVNFVLFCFAGWKYIPIELMARLLTLLLTPSIVWHVTGDIIRAYKKKQLTDIHATQQIDQAFVSP